MVWQAPVYYYCYWFLCKSTKKGAMSKRSSFRSDLHLLIGWSIASVRTSCYIPAFTSPPLHLYSILVSCRVVYLGYPLPSKESWHTLYSCWKSSWKPYGSFLDSPIYLDPKLWLFVVHSNRLSSIWLLHRGETSDRWIWETVLRNRILIKRQVNNRASVLGTWQ